MKISKLILLSLIVSVSFADSVFRGTYTCTVIGKDSASDSLGNKVTYISGNLVVDRNDKVTLRSTVNFNLTSGFNKNRIITGNGKLGKISVDGIFRKTELNFRVIEPISNIVVPTRVALLSTKLLSQITKAATAVIRTPYGILSLSCR